MSPGLPSGCWLGPGLVCAKACSGSLLPLSAPSPHLSVSGLQVVSSGSPFAFSVVGFGHGLSSLGEWPMGWRLALLQGHMQSVLSLDGESPEGRVQV